MERVQIVEGLAKMDMLTTTTITWLLGCSPADRPTDYLNSQSRRWDGVLRGSPLTALNIGIAAMFTINCVLHRYAACQFGVDL